MDYLRITDGLIEILPGDLPPEKVLEEIARLSYELAVTVPPSFAQPFDIPTSLIDFKDVISEKGLHMEYLNGRLCSTFVEKKGDRYFFDANRFKEDRRSPDAFLVLVKQQVEGCLKRAK
ncbi:MAG: hypothetical protein ISS63_16220 [Desulfobacteraceae bacterium]|nr:hypothetical protein [Desulfobacteraceae bacterium]